MFIKCDRVGSRSRKFAARRVLESEVELGSLVSLNRELSHLIIIQYTITKSENLIRQSLNIRNIKEMTSIRLNKRKRVFENKIYFQYLCIQIIIFVIFKLHISVSKLYFSISSYLNYIFLCLCD